jgi:CRISPR/Cas system CSM-associated protein Csm3 (group 7 of RAMP superfamily)
MTLQLWSSIESRQIVRRIVVEGRLVLQSPARFGNGDADDLIDLPLLRDPYDNRTPLLTGASLAGALRSYLREREHGYGVVEKSDSRTALLFGAVKGDDNGEQSPLIIDDALGEPGFEVEVREGVRIDPATRTAADDKLFGLHLWKAGTVFPLRLELLIGRDEDGRARADRLRQSLATALEGLKDGSITLGARKNRGYGRVFVDIWKVTSYDLHAEEGLVAWLASGTDWPDFPAGGVASGPDLAVLLGVNSLLGDRRRFFEMEANFSLEGSLLIRSTGGEEGIGPDMVHLQTKSVQSGQPEPVLSGTSLAGALRSRALRICNTLAAGNGVIAKSLIEGIWGTDMDRLPQLRENDPDFVSQASRLKVNEEILRNVTSDLVQMRVSIDRFTGGARESVLFSQQPAFGDDRSQVVVKMRLSSPQPYEIGVLLLLLKDLWTGDLPLGGEASVGRGRLKGCWANLSWKSSEGPSDPQKWELKGDEQRVSVTSADPSALNGFVSQLSRHLRGNHDSANVSN